MISILYLFLDPGLSYTWREASMIVAKAQGHGPTCACSIWAWVLDFVREGKLPLHSYCYVQQAVLEDDDVFQEVQGQLSERAKSGFIKAKDVCEIVAGERVQNLFMRLGVDKMSISTLTAQRWLVKLNWRYSQKKNGMYIDGHERDNVMAYWEAFIHRWAEYELQFSFWDDNWNPLSCPSDLRPLILVTHNESVFFQNDERSICWSHQDSRPAPKPKGEGQSLMVSDFLTAEWGCLRDNNRCAFSFFYFMLSIDYHTERPALCSNQGKIATGILIQRNLWLKLIAWSTSWRARQMALPRAFSCSITHPVTSSVLHMPSPPPRSSRVRSYIYIFWLLYFINVSQDPKHFWTHFPKGEHMCDGINSLTGERQSFYFPDNHSNYLGWFKRMKQIIRKCGLWPEHGLPVKCTGPKHPEGPASCCCHHILYTQPDFIL